MAGNKCCLPVVPWQGCRQRRESIPGHHFSSKTGLLFEKNPHRI